MSRLPEGVHRRGSPVQAHQQGRVSLSSILPKLILTSIKPSLHPCFHPWLSHKRLTQQKKQRERERKELEALNRKGLANVRVVQRNVVYVVGLGPRFAKEEVRPSTLSIQIFQLIVPMLLISIDLPYCVGLLHV